MDAPQYSKVLKKDERYEQAMAAAPSRGDGVGVCQRFWLLEGARGSVADGVQGCCLH